MSDCGPQRPRDRGQAVVELALCLPLVCMLLLGALNKNEFREKIDWPFLIYLAGKTGRLLPPEVRGRHAVISWVMWQMAGLGPMLGQHGHFRLYAQEKIAYAIERYEREARRLYGVLDGQLAQGEFVAGDYSIAEDASTRIVFGA